MCVSKEMFTSSNTKILQRTDLPPAPIFTVDQVASSVARETDERAQLTHLVLWHYLPIERPQTFGHKVHKQVYDDSGPSQNGIKLKWFLTSGNDNSPLELLVESLLF